MSAQDLRSEYQQGAVSFVHETEQIVAVCLEGDFDLTNASVLQDQIHDGLDRGYSLILDLSDATFIDSSIISVVVRASRAAAQREQVVVMQLGTASIVERVLEIARIDQVLPRARDRQTAMRLIHQQSRPRVGGAHAT